MDKRRAKEIASSPVMINVTHNGMPIYIENIDENSGTANIYPINQPNNKQEVSITNLIEQ